MSQLETEERAIPGLKIPDVMTTAEFWDQDNRLVRIEVFYEDAPECPSEEMDGEGKFYSFSTRHVNYLDLEASTQEEVEAELTERFGPIWEGWIPLGWFSHGCTLWFPACRVPPGVEFRWDGVPFAGVWVADKDVQSNIGEVEDPVERRRKLLDYCEGCCKTYTSWCNGEVYGYVVEVLDPDEEEIGRDSLGGIYDDTGEYIESCIQDSLRDLGVTELRSLRCGRRSA